MANNSATKAHTNATRSALAPASVPADIAALAGLIEKQSAQTAALMAKVEALGEKVERISVAPPAQTQTSAPEPDRSYVAPKLSTRDRILELLKIYGKISTVELIEKIADTKSAIHYNVGELEIEGLAVVVRGKRDPVTKRRGPDVVYHADHIAV